MYEDDERVGPAGDARGVEGGEGDAGGYAAEGRGADEEEEREGGCAGEEGGLGVAVGASATLEWVS